MDKSMFKLNRTYSLRKSRQILRSGYELYQKKRKKLNSDELKRFEFLLQKLDETSLNSDRNESDRLARELEEFSNIHFKKSFLSYLLETLSAIVIALIVATIIRQSWFELYEIPTGSMRPTFKEQDHLTVTKTAYGINVPLETRHYLFEPDLVQRLSVIIWSGDGIANLNSDAKFMGIFPYTKRYIKRCMGKPGDTLYFYGGKIFGFDQNGRDLSELRNNQWTSHLEYIPFTNFEGRRSYKDDRQQKMNPEAIFHQFNQAIGKYRFFHQEIKGEVFNGQQWIKDNPLAQRTPHQTIQTYSDFWGMRNFAEGRILNRSQVESLTSYPLKDMDEGILYLELRHTPSLNYPEPYISDRFGVAIRGFTTIIPLQERHLKALMDNMYTCRFIVKDGRASAYRMEDDKIYPTSPLFAKIPDGVYEFYYGKAYKVGWKGLTTLLPSSDPLYSVDPKNVQKLFNVGIDMNTQVEPHVRNQPTFPNRYIYFRDGDLYAMGGILMTKDDPVLIQFGEKEKKKEEVSTQQDPYIAFKDYGPPLTAEGNLDMDFIKVFGYKVPEKHYLALGDNHAMSQDSRYFGPIPEANMQGAPSLIIWPTGDRWGIPNQKPYPIITLPRMIVWGIAGLISLIWYLIYRYRQKKKIFKKL